ncbi:hypothetical protein BH09ACT7_BH09ACT7_35780 [soil metagenome]
MSVLTLLTTTLVPVVSVISTATVAIWSKRIDARSKQQDREHALLLDFEKRAGDDKKAVLKCLISATMHVKRGAEPLAGTQQTAAQRRTHAIRELYEFRARLGLDDGVAELLIYAAAPVRDLTELLLDEWDREFRDRGYSLIQLDTCKAQLVQTDADEQRWNELKNEEALWLKRLGEESDLDVDALVVLCERTLKAAHTDLRGGYGLEP